MQSIQDSKKAENNPAQNELTTSALAGADFLKKGDYSQLPKGQFFTFKNPIEQMKQYDSAANVGNEGRYALGDNSGAGSAIALASDYRKNVFARDASQNYQDNVAGAAGNIQNALGQAAGAKGATDANVIGALQGLYGSIPKGPGLGGQLLLGGLQAAGSVGQGFAAASKL